MPYFQNVSNSDFIGVYVVSDRQYSKDYRIKPNINTSTIMQNWQDGPYDLSTDVDFGIKYSMDAGNTWNQVSVTLTSGSARTATQVVDDLNLNANFNSMFAASTNDTGTRIMIRSNTNMNHSFRAYIPNITNSGSPATTAEQKLLFNLRAPVIEMPSYFSRYAIGNTPGALIVQLTQTAENFVITNAGLSTTPLADWQFLAGTSGYFNFQNITVDGSDRITQTIEYPCGAKAGDLAKKTAYVYTSSNKNPSQITEIPYTLAGGDLVVP